MHHPVLSRGRIVRWLGAVASSIGALTAAAQPAGKPALPAGFDLADDVFFAASVDPKLTVQLLDSAFVGVALRAPGRVDIGRRNTLPLLVASRFDGARDWALPFHDLAWLVGIDMRSGKVSLAPAFAEAKRPAPAPRGEKPSTDELRSHGAQVSIVDARLRLGTPWHPGCWAFHIVYHDWRSDPALVGLEKAGESSPNEPGGEACRPPSSAQGQVRFRPERSPGGTLRVAGNYSIDVDALGADRSALPATLFVFTREGSLAERVEWRIPVRAAPGARQLSGAIDHALPAARSSPAGAVAYLVLGGQLHGPCRWNTSGKPARP